MAKTAAVNREMAAAGGNSAAILKRGFLAGWDGVADGPNSTE
jgi:hypothetical protein